MELGASVQVSCNIEFSPCWIMNMPDAVSAVLYIDARYVVLISKGCDPGVTLDLQCKSDGVPTSTSPFFFPRSLIVLSVN